MGRIERGWAAAGLVAGLLMAVGCGERRSETSQVTGEAAAPAETLHAALSMGPAEAERRMRALRQQVCGHTVFDWAARVLCDACKVADGR